MVLLVVVFIFCFFLPDVLFLRHYFAHCRMANILVKIIGVTWNYSGGMQFGLFCSKPFLHSLNPFIVQKLSKYRNTYPTLIPSILVPENVGSVLKGLTSTFQYILKTDIINSTLAIKWWVFHYTNECFVGDPRRVCYSGINCGGQVDSILWPSGLISWVVPRKILPCPGVSGIKQYNNIVRGTA